MYAHNRSPLQHVSVNTGIGYGTSSQLQGAFIHSTFHNNGNIQPPFQHSMTAPRNATYPVNTNLPSNTDKRTNDDASHARNLQPKKFKSQWKLNDDIPPSTDADEVKRAVKAFYRSSDLLFDHSSKSGAKMQYKKWKCRVDGCDFAIRIRCDNETGLWHAETADIEHNHEACSQDHVEADDSAVDWGLPDEFKEHIVDTTAALLKHNVEATPLILKRSLQNKFPRHVMCHRDKDNALHGKVASYVTRLNKKNRVERIDNVGDLGRYKHVNSLTVPESLEPSVSYKSPEEIAVALGLDWTDVARPLVLMPPDDLIEEFHQLYGDADNSMSTSVFIVTPASLYTALHVLTKIPSGYRFVYVDGSRNFTLGNGECLMPIGTHDVSYRPNEYKMSQSFRPVAYALVPGERIKVQACFLRLLNVFSKKLFGIDFDIDFGGLDHSAAFAGGYTFEYGNDIKLLLCFFHAMQIIQDKDKSRPYGTIVGTNKEKETFHEAIKGAFRTLHQSKTQRLFDAGFQLIIEFCLREGQNEYADRLLKTFGSSPWNSFFYAVTGRPGVTPQGSSTENYNGRSKKEVKLNVSRSEFLSNQLPKLCRNDAKERTGAKLKQFEGVTKIDESIAILMSDDDIYFESASNKYIVNSPPKIGKKVATPDRLQRYKHGCTGNVEAFRDNADECPLAVLRKMVGAAQTFCLVGYNQSLGCYVGDCKNCFMHLSCPAVVKVRDVNGKLQPSLAETTTPFARRATLGRPQSKGLGGRGGKKRKQELKEPATVGTYYSRLDNRQLENIAEEMKAKVGERKKGQTDVQRKEQLTAAIFAQVAANQRQAATE